VLQCKCSCEMVCCTFYPLLHAECVNIFASSLQLNTSNTSLFECPLDSRSCPVIFGNDWQNFVFCLSQCPMKKSISTV